MRFFPRIREIGIYTCADWRDTLDWTRKTYMQRNRLIFDGAAALEAALNSSVRHDMRTDLEAFPTFTGGNVSRRLSAGSLGRASPFDLSRDACWLGMAPE
ncbi:hypothetical protein [Celeribacter indicus]|uniref:Uncharacterized protein n=1 Tax=Celeribacter indicus TaxID=1208324 RepID=A0A0B5DZE7_9RHOB|nr:hypothetical protein [Celeribacter indicus]AJE48828.1 hypothetical protein P73_4113 [Celeribacter indicus]SDW38510.1 hypothetical protein SAMN05443573_10333 [Celeribacter indicus]